MKAAQHTSYSKHNVTLAMTDMAIPSISPTQVLVKVSAAGVNPLDNMISRGDVKVIVPYRLPQTAGNELVGVIQELGSKVTGFSVGERVFARLPLEHIGAFAEYVAVEAEAIAKVPAYLSDEEAAAVPLTALTIMQALDLMEVKAGGTLFISGGTGGVGAMAIPIAKAKGLKVITNGSSDNAERVLALGANVFIDYKTEDYTKTLSQIDYVLDTLGGEETKKQMSIMKKGGQLVSLRGMPNGAFSKRMQLAKWKQALFGLVGRRYDKMAKQYGVHYHFIFVESNGVQLQEVAAILDDLKIKPSIDTIYPFDEINLALEKVAHGRSRGKTVITFNT